MDQSLLHLHQHLTAQQVDSAFLRLALHQISRLFNLVSPLGREQLLLQLIFLGLVRLNLLRTIHRAKKQKSTSRLNDLIVHVFRDTIVHYACILYRCTTLQIPTTSSILIMADRPSLSLLPVPLPAFSFPRDAQILLHTA